MKINFIIIGIVLSVGVRAQQNSSLQALQSAAVANYPALKDKEILLNASNLRLQNIKTNYYPQLTLSGQATLQSDAISISMPLPQNPISIKQSKDQYKLVFEANQVLYDGGATRLQKRVEEASLAADVQQVEVDIFKVREQINNAYFVLLILQENTRLLNINYSELIDKEKVVSSGIKNGVLSSSDIDVLTAAQITIEQQLAEVDINRQATIQILSLLTGQTIQTDYASVLPEAKLADTFKVNRPELKYFELQSTKLAESQNLVASSLKPKAVAFLQAGYGRPGLNMLDDEFNPYYIAGASVKWNIYDWDKNKRERQTLEAQKQLVDSKRETFNRNLSIDLQNKRAAISKLEEAIRRDSIITGLRKKIVQTTASRLANGTITSTDYLVDLNASTVAEINLQAHKIQLIQAILNYNLTCGIY